jgi:hypothetical protein
MGRKLFALGTAAALLVSEPAPASACGGCFAPPPPTGMPSVVNAHRMAVSISPLGTTLWDQIQYTGNPHDFVWVLPVNGTPMVELADQGFFEALAQVTTITMTAPAPPRTTCADPCGAFPSGFATARADAAPESDGDGGVIVHHTGVVGPYETATIGGEDPNALFLWLEDHGYPVDPGLLPVITYYTERSMNFVALRLSPQAGVDRMQPVRVTAPGLSLTFPLRMVAAGISTDVDLDLFVFAEGRMEAGNYGNAEVDRDSITYDWATSTFSYDANFEDALFAGTGVGTNWVTEFAEAAPLDTISSFASYSDDGLTVHRAAEDAQVVRDALGDAAYLTRIRTRLPPSELDRDLVLRASGGTDVGTQILVTHELNRAPEPACPTICEMPTGIEPGPGSRGSGTSFRCAAGGGASAGSGTALLLLAGLGLSIARRRGAR